MGVGGQRHAPAALPPGRTRYPLYRWLGGPQGRSGQVRKISAPTGIRSPDRPAHSESLYRLSFPGPYIFKVLYVNINKRLCLTTTRFDTLRSPSCYCTYMSAVGAVACAVDCVACSVSVSVIKWNIPAPARNQIPVTYPVAQSLNFQSYSKELGVLIRTVEHNLYCV